MQAEPWKGAHLCPSPPRLGVTGCGRLPAHSLPPLCQRSPFGQQAEGQSQVSTSAVSLAPEGSSRLGRRLPCAWRPARGAGSGGPAGSGTPPAICHPAAECQLATLRPQPGAPNGFLAKAPGKVSEVWLFGLGVSHISLPKGFTFLSLFLHLSRALHAVPSVFRLPLYLRVELLSLLECLLSLWDYFAFFLFIISFQQHMKASGMMRDCFRWFRFLGLSTSRSGLSPAFSGTGKGSYKL